MEESEARTELRKILRTGDVVYTKLLDVSRSGMARTIGVYVGRGRAVLDLTYMTSVVTGYKMDRDRWGLRVHGAGMDMGFAVVYSLGRALWPNGVRCTTRMVDGHHVCRSNDHVNERGASRYHGNRVHRDSGYALWQSWL